MTDHTTEIDEIQPREHYTHLISHDEKPKTENDGEVEVLVFPPKKIGSIGMATVALAKPTAEAFEDIRYAKTSPGIVISSNGVAPITSGEAYAQGLMSLILSIENPVANIRGINTRAYISLDGVSDKISVELENRSEETEQLREALDLQHLENVDGTDFVADENWIVEGEDELNGRLYVDPNDNELLETLAFRLDTIQAKQPKGGDN